LGNKHEIESVIFGLVKIFVKIGVALPYADLRNWVLVIDNK